MIEWIYALIGVGGLGAILSLLLKKLVTKKLLDSIGSFINNFFFDLGVICTLGLAKVKFLKGLWNNVFEPYVVILLRTIIINALEGLVSGMESDNKDTKD